MSKLKHCPCGEIPQSLDVCDAGQGGKWAYVYGSYCNEWHIEFKTQYHDLGSNECMELAIEAWNEATRNQCVESKDNE